MSQGFTKGTPIDTDPTLSLNSDIVVPSQAAVVAYVTSQVGTPVTNVTASAPILSSGGVTPNISIPAATTSVNGYLTSTDWTTFNGKENVLTFSSPLSRTTNTISIPAATTSVNGYLTSTDWTTFNGKIGGSGTTNEIAYFTGGTTIGSLTTGTYPSLTELSYVKGVTSSIQTQLNSIGVTYPANTMKANNTASTAAPSTFTYKDIGEQIFSQTITWSTASPTGVSLKYRWFQIGNVVHFSFYLTSTVAATNSNVFWDHPSDMPTPVTFTGLTTTSNTYLFRYLSTVGPTLTAAPPTGWYGGIRKGSPVVSYNWFFSGTATSILYIQVNGTYFTA